MKHHLGWLAGAFALALAGLACNMPFFGSGTPAAEATLSQLYTAAALTMQASSTQTATPTGQASATNPFPTFPTLGATRTPAPVVLCDAAAFVKDVSIPDGTTIDPGAHFTKTWRLQNVGTCSWTPSYDLVFSSGSRMGAPSSVGLTGNVDPGQSVDLSVNLEAPDTNGQYQGYWMLRNAAGTNFGIGAQAQGAFWVKIGVAGPSYAAYDFSLNACDAAWENNTRDLPCPGSEGDSKGYVIELNDPVLESGRTEDEPSLLTVPKDTYNGFISGTYPAVKIRDGDHFQTLLSCAYKAYSCNVLFSLDYQIGGGAVRNLGRWNEAYEGKYFTVDIDLSSLAGDNVKFILTVSANGNFNQDKALWIAPRISRRGTPPPTNTPTPTFTPTFTPTSTPTPTPSAAITPIVLTP
jgi:Ig-like domain-containing protein